MRAVLQRVKGACLHGESESESKSKYLPHLAPTGQEQAVPPPSGRHYANMIGLI